jgi:hypothetical protein
MKRLSIALSCTVLLASCKKERRKSQKLFMIQSIRKRISKVDSTQVAISDLPIQMEGTDYLIHPVGDLRVYERGSKARYGSSSVIDLSFTISNYGENEITGYLQNLSSKD